jgi:uncharacterized repeat protein (TIGR03803 family)
MPFDSPGCMSIAHACAVALALTCLARPASAAPADLPGPVSLTVLHSFVFTDGYAPFAALLQADDGNFYGTTLEGGTPGGSRGTVFRITPAGEFTSLHSFATEEGINPRGRLAQGAGGWLYGTTVSGGSFGKGTIFRISQKGRFEVVHQFMGAPDDAAGPLSGLTPASDGNLYGTTAAGGRHDDGTVYRLTPEGSVTVVHSFGPGRRGSIVGDYPTGLMQGSDGLLRVTNGEGGNDQRCVDPAGCGTLLAMTLDGEVVGQVSLRDDVGRFPKSALVEASDGRFYGVAGRGGHDNEICQGECGAIYRSTAGGRLSNLHFFDGHDGWFPISAPAEMTDGSLYGTTSEGGIQGLCRPFGCGTIWRLSADGEFSVVYEFQGGDDGFEPDAGLVLGSDGALYGAAAFRGAGGYGTIYRLAPLAPLAPGAASGKGAGRHGLR